MEFEPLDYSETLDETEIIKDLVRSAYDVQKLRVETGNRIVARFYRRLGIEPGEAPDEQDEEVLIRVKASYQRITDGMADVTARSTYEFDEVIPDYISLRFVDRYMKLLSQERRTFSDIERALEGIPIYDEFLKDITGVGTAMAGCIVSELDPYKAPYPSSFWKYCGLDVVDGKGRSLDPSMMEEVEYEDKDGNLRTKKSLGYNPFIKTKLAGVLATSFLRRGSEYRHMFYDPYKERIKTDPRHEDKTDAHIHRMALRYMIKQFLVDLHMKWRYLEGLPITQPYHVAKQGGSKHKREERLGIIDPERHDARGVK